MKFLAVIVFITFLVNINCKPAVPQAGVSVRDNANGGKDLRITYDKQFGNFGASAFGAANTNGGPPTFGASIDYNKQFGNFGAHAFGAANTNGGPPTFGASVDYNKNGNNAFFQHSKTPGLGSTDTFGGTLKLYENGNHRFNANAFGSRSRNRKRRQVDRYGGGFSYQNAKGFGGSIGYEQIKIKDFPLFDQRKIDINANAGWKSEDKRTSLDFNAGASRDIGRFNNGKTDWNAGIELKHRF